MRPSVPRTRSPFEWVGVVRVLEGAWGDVPDFCYVVTRPSTQFHRQDHYLYVSDAFCTKYPMPTKGTAERTTPVVSAPERAGKPARGEANLLQNLKMHHKTNKVIPLRNTTVR